MMKELSNVKTLTLPNKHCFILKQQNDAFNYHLLLNTNLLANNKANKKKVI